MLSAAPSFSVPVPYANHPGGLRVAKNPSIFPKFVMGLKHPTRRTKVIDDVHAIVWHDFDAHWHFPPLPFRIGLRHNAANQLEQQ